MAEEGYKDQDMNLNPDKDYGLPKVEIKPIQETQNLSNPTAIPSKSNEEKSEIKQELPRTDQTKSLADKKKPSIKHEEKKSNYSWLLILLLLLGLGAGGWFYYSSNNNSQDSNSNNGMTEKNTKLPTEVQEEPPQPVAADSQPPAEEEVVKPVKEITLTEIKSRADAPRYFVVVGSFVDEDMAKDYSLMLHEKQMSTFLVYPYGEIAYYRLAIGQFESFALASREIDRVKDGFKENLWVLKY